MADFPDLSNIETSKSRTEMVINLIKREEITLRELLARFAHIGGHYLFAGTAEQVADLIEDWFLDGAADGFNLIRRCYRLCSIFLSTRSCHCCKDVACSELHERKKINNIKALRFGSIMDLSALHWKRICLATEEMP